jgi:hypothetical protein
LPITSSPPTNLDLLHSIKRDAVFVPVKEPRGMG